MSGFDNMGKPIPEFRRQKAYDACRSFGLNADDAWACVGGMAEQLERDKPYIAMEKGRQLLDLTGTYRVLAVLLAEEQS